MDWKFPKLFGAKKMNPTMRRNIRSTGRGRASSVFGPANANTRDLIRGLDGQYGGLGYRNLIYTAREISQTSTHIQGFFQMIKQQAIGDQGIYPTFENVENDRDRATLQMMWDDYSNDPTIYGDRSFIDALEGSLESWVTDGQAFWISMVSSDYPQGFAVLPIGREYLAEQKEDIGNRVARGMKFTEKGRITHYVFYEGLKKVAQRASLFYFNNSTPFLSPLEGNTIEIPAERVMVIQRPNRHDSQDGSLSPILSALRDIVRIRELDQIAARSMAIAGNKMGFITRGAEFDGDGSAEDISTEDGSGVFRSDTGERVIKDEDGNIVIDEADRPTAFLSNYIQELEKGEDFTAFDPAFPNIDVVNYRGQILRGISAALGVDFATFNAQSNDANNASLRLFAVQTRGLMKRLQNVLERQFVRPVTMKWLDFHSMPGGMLSKLNAKSLQQARMTPYHKRVMPLIDPQKDMAQYKLQMEMGIISPEQVARDLGINIKDTVKGWENYSKLIKASGEADIRKAMDFAGVLGQSGYLAKKGDAETKNAGETKQSPPKPPSNTN